MGRTEGRDDPEAEESGEEQEEATGRKQLVDLNVAQVAGAGAATLTAATAASAFNVYGTVIGTAVMAVLSTAASPWLSHWFSRSGQQAKQLAGKAVGHPPENGGTASAGSGARSTYTGTTGTDAPEDADPTRTMAMPVVGNGGPAAAGAPETYQHRGEADGPDGRGTADGAEGHRAGGRPPHRSRRAVIISAAVVFALVMLVILVFELLTGRSLTAWTRGVDEPTAPSLLGGTTSAPPAEEGDPGPEPTGEDPDSSGEEPGTQDPGTEQPEGTEPGQEPAPEGEGEDGADQPPAEEDGPQDPGDQDPGEQEPDGQDPDPGGADPGQDDGGSESGQAE